MLHGNLWRSHVLSIRPWREVLEKKFQYLTAKFKKIRHQAHLFYTQIHYAFVLISSLLGTANQQTDYILSSNLFLLHKSLLFESNFSRSLLHWKIKLSLLFDNFSGRNLVEEQMAMEFLEWAKSSWLLFNDIAEAQDIKLRHRS